jgi:hypothetical protein
VDALDPVELDVAGGGRAADPGERTGRLEPAHGLGDGLHDLVGAHDAQVQVGHERQRPPALVGPASSTIVPVSATATAHAVTTPATVSSSSVEVAAVVAQHVGGAGPLPRQPGRHDEPAVRRGPGEHVGDRARGSSSAVQRVTPAL